MFMKIYATLYCILLTFIFGGVIVADIYESDKPLSKADFIAIMVVIAYIPIMIRAMS